MNSRSARLIIQSGPNAGKIVNVATSLLALGRESGNDVVLNDPEISRRHARLVGQAGGYLLQDLNSTNGTFVNGQPVYGRVALQHGDQIQLGGTVQILFEQDTEEATAPHSSPPLAHDTVIESPTSADAGTPPASPPELDLLAQANKAYPAPPSPYRAMPMDIDAPAARLDSPSTTGAPPSRPRRRRPWLTCAVVVILLLLACTATLFWLDAYHPDVLYGPLEPLFRLLRLMD